MFEQVWSQVEQITALSNSAQVITDTDIDINNMQLIIPNKKASLHPIHLNSQIKGVNITISNCSMEGLRLTLDNANISLYIGNSTFTAAAINIQSEDNTECLPVHIQSCHFSGHIPEDTLLFNNTDNVSVESCHFTDLQFNNDESSVIKGINSFFHIDHSVFTNNRGFSRTISLNGHFTGFQFNNDETSVITGINSSFHIDHSVFTNNTGYISIHGGSSQIISCSFTKSTSCLRAEVTTVNISLSKFDGNRDGCIYGYNAVLHIVKSSLTSNIGKRNGGAVRINGGHVTLYDCSLINNTAWQDGGAVYAEDNSHVTLGNCSLINNTARWYVDADAIWDGYWNGEGGAVNAEDNSQVTLGDCSLINNTASEGGAVSASRNSHVTLVNCSLINNTARQDGGAVYAKKSNVTLGNCSLINNTAGEDGGAVFAFGSQVTLGNCSLINNTAGEDGGAVFALGSQVTLGNCSLINNTAMWGGAVSAYIYRLFVYYLKVSVLLTDSHLNSNRAGQDGGAIHIKYAHITMKRCSLSNNEAKQDGGAVNIDIDGIDTDNILIDNNFTGNTAMNGGALRVTRIKITLKGCRMIDNSAKQDGGAIKVHVQTVINMASVQFVNNTAGSGGGAVMVLDHSELQDTGSIYIQNLARGFGEYGSTFVTLEG